MSDQVPPKDPRYIDGSPIFQTAADLKNEEEVAALLRVAWNCEVTKFADLSAVDWYFTRRDRLIGLAELKSRNIPDTKHETVYLSVSKWLALNLGSIGLGVPGLFVVKFTNSVRWCELGTFDATKVKIGGNSERWFKEPLIEVPIEPMKVVKAGEVVA